MDKGINGIAAHVGIQRYSIEAEMIEKTMSILGRRMTNIPPLGIADGKGVGTNMVQSFFQPGKSFAAPALEKSQVWFIGSGEFPGGINDLFCMDFQVIQRGILLGHILRIDVQAHAEPGLFCC